MPTGFATKSWAPARIADTTLSMPPWAVCPITPPLPLDVPPINVAVLPALLRAAVANVERHIENDEQANVGDPAVLWQQARNKAGGEAHQCNGYPQTEYQDNGMLAGSPRDR